MTLILIFFFAIVFIVGITTLWGIFLGYMENKQDELWIERFFDYIENIGAKLAEKRNRRDKE